MDLTKYISQLVRSRRESLKLTQLELAKKAGLSRVSINQIENGIQRPSIEHLIELGDVLGFNLLQIELHYRNSQKRTLKTGSESIVPSIAAQFILDLTSRWENEK